MSARRSIPALILFAALAANAPAWAQQNGNTYNGVHNQPTLGSVRSKEDAAGVALPPPQQHQQTQETDKLYDQLMKQEGVQGPAASATGTVPPSQAVPAARQ